MEINLRKLKIEDALGMMEWMSDSEINALMQFNTDNVSLERAEKFILDSWKEKVNLHLAIVDKDDAYLGTISLKNIDKENRNAEYAIAIRKCAMGTGISRRASDMILYIAFELLKLHKIYLYLRSDNLRAARFYEKYYFVQEGIFKEHMKIHGEYKDILWFGITKNEYHLKCDNTYKFNLDMIDFIENNFMH